MYTHTHTHTHIYNVFRKYFMAPGRRSLLWCLFDLFKICCSIFFASISSPAVLYGFPEEPSGFAVAVCCVCVCVCVCVCLHFFIPSICWLRLSVKLKHFTSVCPSPPTVHPIKHHRHTFRSDWQQVEMLLTLTNTQSIIKRHQSFILSLCVCLCLCLCIGVCFR